MRGLYEANFKKFVDLRGEGEEGADPRRRIPRRNAIYGNWPSFFCGFYSANLLNTRKCPFWPLGLVLSRDYKLD
jgi:hypothetical protein